MHGLFRLSYASAEEKFIKKFMYLIDATVYIYITFATPNPNKLNNLIQKLNQTRTHVLHPDSHLTIKRGHGRKTTAPKLSIVNS